MNGTIRHGKLYFLAPEGWLVTTLICRTEPKNRNSSIVRKLKTKQEMHRRNGPVTKSWSQSWGRKVLYGVKDCKKEVGFKPALKEWGTSGWWELWVDKWRRCRIVAKKISQRQSEIRSTETSRQLINKQGQAYPKEQSWTYTQQGWWPSKSDERWRANAAVSLNRYEIMEL